MRRSRGLSSTVALAGAVAVWITCLSSGAAGAPVPATPTGRIVGRLSNPGGAPLEFATVGVVGSRIGTLTDEQGRFVLVVPAGETKVQIQAFGAPILRTVLVVAGATVTLDVVSERKVVTIPEIEVSAARKIDAQNSDSHHEMNRQQIQDALVDDPIKVAALKAGVVLRGEAFHVRGGRPDEMRVRVNGMEVVNPQTLANASVATLAVEGLTLRTGGLDAEHGGTLSSIIDITTREGADSLFGQTRWDTDRFGDPTKTFNNFDRFTIGLGGPTSIPELTWFGAYEGTFSDTHLRSSVTRPRRTLFDYVRLGNRQFNQVNSNLKLAYRPTQSHKLTLETINNHTLQTPYEHMWSRSGYVDVRHDTARTDGRITAITPRYGSWSPVRRDDHDVFVNLPDDVPSNDTRFRQIAGVWTYQIAPQTVWAARFSSVDFRTLASVARKTPWEYWIQSPFYWSGNVQQGSENNPYFATHGDFPRYARRHASTWAAKGDLSTARWKQHRTKVGFETKYNRVENLTLTLPNDEVNGLPGGNRSEYVNYNPEGATYLQDRWEFEGLVLNAGLRYDLFTPGDQISDLDLRSGKRYKQQLSPRLGVAYPISDKDALSFHYGWTYQTPARGAIFENRGLNANVNTRGNPDLEPETNVSYQAAMQHLFARDVSGQFAVFFRDIYGLITIRQERDDFGNLVNVFFNGDYASSRGFEASVAKHFSHKFSADLHYTYSIASGVASDPAQAQQFFNGGRLFLPISERALEWDQRHTVSLSSVMREPGQWGFRMLWTYGSGFPFTPTFRGDRRQDPVLENSRRLPSNFNLTLDADKFYRVWGRDVTLFVEARNLLNSVNIANVSPNNNGFPNPHINPGGQDDYLVYYSETGRAGGAYLRDINGDQQLDWVPVHDPRVYEEARNVRMGVNVSF